MVNDMVITDQRVEFEVLEPGMLFFYSGMFWSKHDNSKGIVVHTSERGVMLGYIQKFEADKLVNIVVTNRVIKLLDASKAALYNTN